MYQALVHQAWENGDPGVIFLDRINEDNPTPALGEMESTNPCGEQPLLPLEACNLGSINLAKFVVENNGSPAIDYDTLKEVVWLSVRFLDDVIDMSKYPLPEIVEVVQGNRKVGLGVMGFSDLLYQMGIPYNSENALALAEEIMCFIQQESREASKYLAKERGTFENYNQSIFKDMEECAFRNATTTTIAPTGTLSIIAGCSSGIEPLFALSFVRRVMDNDELLEVNPYFEKVAKERGFYSRELMDTVARQGSIHDMEEIPEDVREVFVTAHDVTPEWHVRMQAAFQKYTDNAVSKTVNLPRDATVDDVLKVYNLAYELGCKGVTIYRDGSKENQVLSYNEKTKMSSPLKNVEDRPETLEGFTTKMPTGYGNLYVTVTEHEGKPFEVFATIGKSGKSTTAKTEAIGRLVSLALRSGVQVEHIIEQLKGIGGEHPVFQKDGLVLSIPDAISRVLEKRYSNDRKKKNGRKHEQSLRGETCPDCGQTISFEEGCMTCHFCGFTKCG
jgi:ribonucleoside-diphosphate reductase alpha chain